MEITSINIDPFDKRDYIIQWEYSNAKNRPTSDFDLFIYRSTIKDQDDKYSKLSGKLSLSTPIYKDKKTSKLDIWKDVYYKIELVDKVNGGSYFFGPQGLGQEPSSQDRLIIKHKRRKLFKTGRSVLIFKNPRDGLRCECYNPILQKIEKPNCSVCGGTGFVKGFDGYVYTKFFFPPEAMQEPNKYGDEQPVIKNFITSDFPHIRSGDMIVDTENRRFIVSVVQSVNPRGVLIGQNISALRVKSTDVIMGIPVPDDFKKLGA